MQLRATIVFLFGLVAASAGAQPLGTFRWQLEPYCNLVTVTVTQAGATYRLEGTDDRCGAAEASSVIGTAFLNPDGSIGLGLNVVAAPGGQPHPVSARVALSTLNGTWNDPEHGGAFTFTPGAATGGSLRPLPTLSSGIPEAIRFEADGSFVAGGTFQQGTWPASGAGVRLMWAPAKAAFRAGRVLAPDWDDANSGSESAALNQGIAAGQHSFAVNGNTRADGIASTTFGTMTIALGGRSVAAGSGARALGEAAFAAGGQATAGGASSVAVGLFAQASGPDSVAFGYLARAGSAQSVALGDSEAAGARAFSTGFGFARNAGSVALAAGSAYGNESVALGTASASAEGTFGIGSAAGTSEFATGSFVFGDRSTTARLISTLANQFLVRAAGGVGFYTNTATDSGVELATGGGSWDPLSDARGTENFRDIPGDEILARLDQVPVREWNYTTQDASIRHLGPTAQDFRAAFGLGDFPLRINTVDADGVALAAAKALDTATRGLAERHDLLARENERLRAVLDTVAREHRALLERLTRLEQQLGGR